MFRLFVTLSAFGIVFGACSTELPTVQEAVAQTDSASATDEGGDAPPRNPETHDIYPTSESQGVAAEASSSSDDDGPDGVVNLNGASAEQLQNLPGVGPAIAERIVAYRNKRRFEKPAHITRVKGVGDATFEKLKAHLAVDGETTLSE